MPKGIFPPLHEAGATLGKIKGHAQLDGIPIVAVGTASGVGVGIFMLACAMDSEESAAAEISERATLVERFMIELLFSRGPTLRAETRGFELLKGLTPYLVSSEARSTGLCDVSKWWVQFAGKFPSGLREVNYFVGPSAGALNKASIGFIAATCPTFCIFDGLAVGMVASDQPSQPNLIRDFNVIGLVK